uniref:PIN domain-containing protein n=1 Tax=Thermofilum pendens TaxID=2269 RepID=A0A7J3X5H8_THEPE
MPELLFDASSLIKVLKLGRVELLARSYIQWLTYYEVLNAIWKEAHLLKTIPPDKAAALAKLLNRVIRFMRVSSVEGLEEEVLRTAIDLDLTAYDSSYVVLARKLDLKLVTEDRRLRAKAQKLVKCTSVEELVTGS